jgi:hypothetical protein
MRHVKGVQHKSAFTGTGGILSSGPRGMPSDPQVTLCDMTVGGVSREAAIADYGYGVVRTGELEEDWLSYDAAATGAARASRQAPAEVVFDRGLGYARLCGGAWYADVDVVGS